MNLIFDMDGTLADTALATIPAIRQQCELAGWLPPGEAEIRAAIGTANPDFYYQLFPNHSRDAVYALGQRVESSEEDWVRDIGEGMLFPGVRAMLEDLSRLDIPMYIASSGSHAHVDIVLESARINKLFQSIHCNEAKKSRMVARIVGGGDPERWALLGDRDNDLNAARNNDILALGAAFGYCPQNEWPKYDFVFMKPSDVVVWMNRKLVDDRT